MNRLEEVERAVIALTADEYRAFRQWFFDRDWAQWDQQLEEDAKAGKLDFLIEQALEAKRQGMLGEL